ncbi:MAG: hypothetical protein AB1551_05855, partial [Actinomycetota bacterium]
MSAESRPKGRPSTDAINVAPTLPQSGDAGGAWARSEAERLADHGAQAALFDDLDDWSDRALEAIRWLGRS